MEELIMLGTGNATVTRCFNTCFAIRRDEECFLVDTGGGNGILTQLEKSNIPLDCIHEIFISHEHTDHLLGIVWMIRMIATQMKKDKYEGKLNIYCHEGLVDTIMTICKLTVQDKFYKMIGDRILLNTVNDKEVRKVFGHDMTFFDIGSEKARQFGFTMKLDNGRKFTFLGDEPYRECEYEYAVNADWFLHEAFCLYRDRDIYKPYEKFHATVKEACEYATQLHAKNVILYHTEDRNLLGRKQLYTEEGQAYYHGKLYVPDDLERIEL